MAVPLLWLKLVKTLQETKPKYVKIQDTLANYQHITAHGRYVASGSGGPAFRAKGSPE